MSIILFSNNALTTIAGSISSSATSVTFSPGSGVSFPSPTTNQFYSLTHINATSGLPDEIAYVTAMSGDVATITRGQEGTTAVAWNSGDIVVNQLTAGGVSTLAQKQQVQQGTLQYAADTGSVNAYAIALTPSSPLTDGMPIRFKTANANTTTTPTLAVNSGSPVTITQPGGGDLSAGQILANAPITVIYNSTGPRFELQQSTNLTAAFGGSNQSLSADGYQVLPGGLILQWATSGNITVGYGTVSSGNTLSWPKVFPNGILSAMVSNNNVTGVSALTQITNTSNSGVTFSVYNEANGGSGSTTSTSTFFAIGY